MLSTIAVRVAAGGTGSLSPNAVLEEDVDVPGGAGSPPELIELSANVTLRRTRSARRDWQHTS